MRKNRGNILVIIVAILALVLLAGGGYFYWRSRSQPQPEATWKTYTNTKFHYTIDYPAAWSAREYPDSQDGASFSHEGTQAVTIDAGPKISNYATEPFEDYVKVAGSIEIQNYGKLSSLKPVTTMAGPVGYETTWGQSLPIAYFAVPGTDHTGSRQPFPGGGPGHL
ncbi:MAG: hypothetical protein M1484_00815 [Patescibacteria group bacterium]|nr:hypothetical protein [Patescibacteria group bacterium]MCL5431621.1 hypothetical protein [Patescibacteria group bacterium]